MGTGLLLSRDSGVGTQVVHLSASIMVVFDTGGITLFILGTLMTWIESAVSELSTEECFAVGLNKANLVCSSCDTLKEFSLQSIESNCRKCCQEDDVTSSPTKYPRAQLEVCG